MLKFLLFISIVFTLSYAEKSSFGAGSLDSDNPYGLSESEKIIFENKKQLRYQKREISALKEQIDGMRSVVESMSMKLGQTGERINELNSQKDEQNESELSLLKSEIEDLKRIQKDNYESINSVLKKLGLMIDKIDSSYVSKDDMKNQVVKKKSKQNKKLTSSDKLNKAINLYRKKYYTKSFPLFEELANKSYKPAKSNYYLGEISYYKKHYSDAIVYFKKSAGYYDKASYMPVLFLHTGISFEKLNDIENKQRFLEALLSSYPNSPEAKIARKHL
jgi:TolA-binding protein